MHKISKFEATVYASYTLIFLLTIGVVALRCHGT